MYYTEKQRTIGFTTTREIGDLILKEAAVTGESVGQLMNRILMEHFTNPPGKKPTKKIDIDRLRELLSTGMMQKDIAKIFGVSSAKISVEVKKLREAAMKAEGV